MAVYRYFIDDALFLALNTEQNSHYTEWGLVAFKIVQLLYHNVVDLSVCDYYD